MVDAGFQPLRGLRVVDLSRGVAGGYCAKLFSDAGAEVVRVERPSASGGDECGGPARVALAAHLHTGKRALGRDLEDGDVPGLVARLCAAADGVIEDHSPGWLAARGMGYEVLSGANPRLVMTSVTPYGQTGPYRDFRGTDLLIDALGGGLAKRGIAPLPPTRLAPDATWFLAGASAAGATLAAMRAAARDGAGDHLDVAAVETALGAPDRGLLFSEFCGDDPPRLASPRPLQSFACSDGFIAIALNRGVERVAEAIGVPDLTADPRFATNMSRQAHAGELEALILPWTIARTRREAAAELQRHKVICAPVYQPGDLFDDPQFLARNCFQSVHYAGVDLRLPRPPYRRAGDGPIALRPPPEPEASPSPAPAWMPRAAGLERQPGAPRLPLNGLRVIDLGDAWAGPYGCVLLADAGAEVIRIEDVHRMPANMRGPVVPAPPFNGYRDRDPGERPWERFYLYNGCERNKYGITLDLKQEAGRAVFLRLVERADVLVSNLTMETLRAMRLTYADVSARNPKIVMLQISGYGLDGPYANRVALGTTIDAITGHQSQHGYPDTAPAESAQTYYPDAATAYTGAFVALAALAERDRTGRGLHVDLALSEVMFAHLAGAIGAATDTPRPITGNRDTCQAPQGCYPAKPLDAPADGPREDDRWIAIACESESQWVALAEAMGRADLVDDTRFASAAARRGYHDELDALIGAWTSRHDARALAVRLQGVGVPAMPVLHDADVFADPHIAERRFLRDVEHRYAGTFRGPGPIWRGERYAPAVRLPANGLGEHNRLVLQEWLGVDDAEFAALEAAHVCGERYVLEGSEVP